MRTGRREEISSRHTPTAATVSSWRVSVCVDSFVSVHLWPCLGSYGLLCLHARDWNNAPRTLFRSHFHGCTAIRCEPQESIIHKKAASLSRQRIYSPLCAWGGYFLFSLSLCTNSRTQNDRGSRLLLFPSLVSLVSLSPFPQVYTVKKSPCCVRRPSVPFHPVIPGSHFSGQSFRAASGLDRRSQRLVFIIPSFSPRFFFCYHRSRPRTQNHAQRIREYARRPSLLFSSIRSKTPA